MLRTPWESLTRPGHGGGTLIDGAISGWRDRVLEAFPLVDDGFLAVEEVDWGVDGDTAWARFTGPGVPLVPLGEGSAGPVEVTWRIRADEPVVTLVGADGLWLRPAAGAEWLDAGFALDGFAVLTDGVAVEAPTGALWLDGVTALHLGPVDSAGLSRWPDGAEAEGACAGEAVEVWQGDALVLVLGPDFATRVPDDAELRCVLAGHAPSEATAPGTGLDLVPGDAGGLWLRVQDDHGAEVPVAVSWVDGRVALPPGGGWIPLPPGAHQLVVDAGPAHDRWRGEVAAPGADLGLTLRRAIDTDRLALVELGRDAWPSWTATRSPAEDLADAAATGRRLVVQTPRDEVGLPDTEDGWMARHVRAEAGSLVVSEDEGSVWSWPWSPTVKRAGHGAVDATDRPAQDLLALASSGPAGRFTAVDAAWVAAAGEPWTWDPRPDLLRLESLDDLPTLLGVLEHGVAIGITGPLAWVGAEHDGLPAATTLERDLVTGRACATTGPWLGLAAGSAFVDAATGAEITPLTLTLAAPAAADVDALVLLVDGIEVARADLAREATSAELAWIGPVARHAVGVAEGADWAVAAPILRLP